MSIDQIRLLAVRLHPSCYRDDIHPVISISHSQGTIQSAGTHLMVIRHRVPHEEGCDESHASSATKPIYARWRCNRTDMKSATMVNTPG